jgi:hypothetical protein
MVKSYLRGHEIEFVNNEWLYSDTKVPTVQEWKERNCGHCGLSNTPEGHDGCLGTLPGLMNACCGHGEDTRAYVQFLDGSGIHGIDSVTIMNILKKQ